MDTQLAPVATTYRHGRHVRATLAAVAREPSTLSGYIRKPVNSSRDRSHWLWGGSGDVMRSKFLGLMAFVSLLGLSPANAMTYTFAVDYFVNAAEVTGTIVTTSDSGTLTSSEITSYTFNFFTVTISGVSPSIYGSNLIATPTTISYTPTGLSTDFIAPSGCIYFDDLACEDNPLTTGQYGEEITDGGSNTGITYTPIVIATMPATPLSATLPLFATDLGALGLFGWRGKRNYNAAWSARSTR
jgi:hypothetical protein